MGTDNAPGRVVMINGGSSAGKTTLGRKLQEVLDGAWLLLGVDLLLWMLPPKRVFDPEWFSLDEGRTSRGPASMSAYASYRLSAAALAKSGADILIDDVTLEGAVDQRRWNESLRGLDVCWVGVRCDPDLAHAREVKRGDRPPGIARAQALSVHDGVAYDVEVDSGVLELAQSVDLITDVVRRRWPVASRAATNEPPDFPLRSAWTSAADVGPAPWES